MNQGDTGHEAVNNGTWQDGAFYSGGYEVVFASLRHGGKNFLQTAKISFDVEVSK